MMDKAMFSKVWDILRYTLLGVIIIYGIYALFNGQGGTPSILRWCIYGYVILHSVFKYALKIYVPKHRRESTDGLK